MHCHEYKSSRDIQESLKMVMYITSICKRML